MEILASFLNLEEILRWSELRVELPDLSSDVIVERAKPWTSSLRKLELPHCWFWKGEETNSLQFATEWKKQITVIESEVAIGTAWTCVCWEDSNRIKWNQIGEGEMQCNAIQCSGYWLSICFHCKNIASARNALRNEHWKRSNPCDWFIRNKKWHWGGGGGSKAPTKQLPLGSMKFPCVGFATFFLFYFFYAS